MAELDSEMQREENTVNDFRGKLELVSNTNMITKEELLQKFVAKDITKNKIITVAGQMFIENEKKLDASNQVIKNYEDYIGDKKI